jgi:hypothetical protein
VGLFDFQAALLIQLMADSLDHGFIEFFHFGVTDLDDFNQETMNGQPLSDFWKWRLLLW